MPASPPDPALTPPAADDSTPLPADSASPPSTPPEERDELTLDQLTAEMAGGQELDALKHELGDVDPGKRVDPADPEVQLAGPGKPQVQEETSQ